MKKTMVIVNPASAGGSTGRSWTRLRRLLAEARPRFEERFTSRPGEATALVREALGAGYRELIVVGGDGTLNEAVNGLFPSDPEAGIGTEPMVDDAVLVPVRRGTGGDFARHFGLAGAGRSAFAHLRSTRITRLDLGLCEYAATEGGTRRRAFVNVGSFGLSGLVDVKVNASTKRFGSLSFASATVSALVEFRRPIVRVEVDGERFYEGPLLLGAVCNGAYFGGGVRIAPEADPSSGRWSVVLLTEAGPREVVRVLDVFRGRHVRWSSARVTQGCRVEARLVEGGPCLLDLDGEQPGGLDARFSLVPDAVSLLA